LSTSSALAFESCWTPTPTPIHRRRPELQVGVVVFRANLGAADVFQQHEPFRRPWAVLDDDVFKLLRVGSGRRRARHLEGLLGSEAAAELSGGTRRSAPQRVGHVERGQPRAPPASGSSQMRIAYLRSPKMTTSPTPGTRFSASLT
jgi:hypothetical protein